MLAVIHNCRLDTEDDHDDDDDSVTKKKYLLKFSINKQQMIQFLKRQ